MNKKVLRAGAVSAVAAGIGAAAVMAGKRRSKKEEENSDYRNTELGKFAKNSKGIYYTNGNYEAFARPEKPEGIEEKSAYLVGSTGSSLLFSKRRPDAWKKYPYFRGYGRSRWCM